MTKKAKEIEVVVVSFEEYHNPEVHYPSKWFIRNSEGDYEFVKVQKREKAQEYFDLKYGAGKFSIRSA